MRRSVDRCLALAAAAASALLCGRAAKADDSPPPPQVIADFESPDCLQELRTGGGVAEVVEQKTPKTGHALHWTLDPTPSGSSYLYLRVATPPDLAKYHVLQFRIRLDGDRPGALYARLENDDRAWLGARVRGVGAEWKTMSLDLDAMERDGRFDPATVTRVDFVVFRGAGGSYQLDDVELVAAMPSAAAGKPSGSGAKTTKYPVADFEAPESTDFVEAHHGTAARVPAGAKEKGFVLAWTPATAGKTSFIELSGAPRDVRECRTLRFRIRADKPVTQPMNVRLEASTDDVLDGTVKAITKDWKAVELKIPEMDVLGEFDPRRLKDISFIFFSAPDATVQIDDVELETGGGGWRLTEAEMIVHAFGDARAKKVAKIPTKHFDVYTDSAAAQGAFPKALEDAYEFAKKTLALPEMDEKLPVYIFQNSTLYVDFTVRFAGWTKAAAEQSAGHGCGRYFATYYQSPDAPVVVHELTHSMVHRALGPMGGSWFQEGVAVYVEKLWQHQSAAELLAPNLRSGQFVHLSDLMNVQTLLFEKDVKGGPRTPERLYLEAGAFYEFLVRGPTAAEAPGVVAALARTHKSPAEEGAFVANLLGRPIEDVEKDWIAWGGNPPKAK